MGDLHNSRINIIMKPLAQLLKSSTKRRNVANGPDIIKLDLRIMVLGGGTFIKMQHQILSNFVTRARQSTQWMRRINTSDDMTDGLERAQGVSNQGSMGTQALIWRRGTLIQNGIITISITMQSEHIMVKRNGTLQEAADSRRRVRIKHG